MGSYLDLTRLLFARLGMFLFSPVASGLLLAVLWLVWAQYRRTAAVEAHLFGAPKNAPLRLLGDSLVHGVLAGATVSLIGLWAGVVVIQPEAGAPVWLLLWPVALALGLLHPRFLCFSYATTLIGVSSLLFDWPRVDIPSLAALVGLLHLAEALLIWTGGAGAATPVTLRNRAGEVVGAFQLQRFWPVPLVLPIGVLMSNLPPDASPLHLPSWWPLIQPDPTLAPASATLALDLVPVVVAMGYSDLAVTALPPARARRSAGWLALYSLVLLGLAALASRSRILLWAAALFSGLGHEYLAVAMARRELRGSPAFTRPWRGVGVLDVLPGSPAAAAGLRTGDVILQVSGRPVSSRADLEQAITESPAWFWLSFRQGHEVETRRIPRPPTGLEGLGVILIPEAGDQPLVTPLPGRLARLAGAAGRWWRGRRHKGAA